ncbi:MAG: hypothetical protein ACRD3Q_13045 [Terriglobales bacterium]
MFEPDPNDSPDVSAVAPVDAPQASAPPTPTAQDAASVAPTSTTQPDMPAPTEPQPQFKAGVITRLGSALAGLAMNGIPGAVEGAIDPRAIAAAKTARNATQVAAVKFQSARAAQAVAEASRDAWNVDHLPEQLQQEHDQFALQQIQAMHEFGVPLLTVVDTQDDGTSAKNALASVAQSAPGGQIPHIATINMGGKAYVFSLDRPASNIDQLNQLRTSQGLPAIPQSDYDALKPEQRIQLADDAVRLFAQPFDPRTAAAQLADLQSKRDVYAATTPQWKDGRQATLNMYERRIQAGRNAISFFDQRERQQLAIKAAVAQQQSAYNESVKQDVTGWTPADGFYMNQKQLVGARSKFTNSPAYKTAQSAETSYQMANAAYAQYKQAGGKLPTGAQSMLMLSQHLATTFGTVKGSRVTKDMIQEHLGARGVSDAAEVAVQRAVNGDQLSPAQWDAFHDLIGQARTQAWDSAIRSAHASGLPVTPDLQLPKDIISAQQPKAAPAGGTVRVTLNGQMFTIPASNLAAAKQRGAVEVQQ